MHFGLVLGAFWEPKSGQVGPKSVLKQSLFKKVDVHETLENIIQNHFLGPKMASRPVQDGSKSDKKVMHFSS